MPCVAKLTPAEAERQLRNPFAGKSGSMARPRAWFNWDDARVSSKDINEFRARLLTGLRRLPAEQRAQELDALLREIDPGFADSVLAETGVLVSQGHEPHRALEAALGAVLAARRKKHWWIILNVIVPFQAEKVAKGIYTATSDPQERARRIEHLIELLRPEQPVPFVPEEARRRLHELGVSTDEIENAISGYRITAHDIAQHLDELLRRGVVPVEALRRVLVIALREYAIEHFKSHPVAQGVEFCIWGSVVAAAVSVIGTVVGVAVPMSQQVHAERQARRAQNRQRAAPLSAGEVEQIIAGTLQSGATAWGAQQRQAALDYIRVNRFGRTSFVEPEERNLQTAFANARAAIVAQQEAARRAQEKKTLIGVGLGIAALVGGALILRSARS